jgi:tetratricopeptide (TPR) repeat protein/NADPH-dependent 7-cyano-7-deazaguanine reductase QueF-like protein
MERKRLAQVVERLNSEIRGIATVRPVRWETSFYKAHTTFQKQIPEAAECEIVIGILRHRLGSELPDDFPKMPNGEPYPSGTAYEVLTALERRRTAELPDVYVFRYAEPPTVRLDDAEERKRVESQWESLKGFFSTWFVTPKGQLRAAFQTFDATDDFETKVEALLRQWIAERILHGRSVVWPVAILGSPFRGLEAFDAGHAPVFFGRSRDIARAVSALQETAEHGTPYLMIIGPSGAGKSSIARAGLVPRVTAPGVIAQVDVWRVATMRPAEKGGDPFMALAECLLKAEREPEVESGSYRLGLAEIAQDGFTTPRELADLLHHADTTAVRALVHALEQVAETERIDAGYERPVSAALLLLVDQLDELLGADVSDEVRKRFAALLRHLCRSGRVWVVTTLRADLYERYIAIPELLALKTEGASHDLQPPGPAELAEIVRAPAKAAELVYEVDANGRSLDERLLADAERADILPLVQFTLNRLFEERIEVDGEIRLTYAAYEAMGGLDGAINHEAERALARLSEADVDALPRLLRELATPSRSGPNRGPESGQAPLTIRTVPFERVAHDPHSERLVEALIQARILLTSGEENVRSVRIAHQRVLNSWQRAREIVAEHADFFRIRAEVEEERRRWEAAGKARDRLIPPGLRLAEAESIQKRFSDEIPAATRAFVALSGNRARLRQRLTATAAVVFFGVAAAAGYLGWLSRQSALAEQAARQEAQERAHAAQTAREAAEQNFQIARRTVDAITSRVASGLRGSAGVPLETVQRVLSDLESAVDELSDSAGEGEVSLWRSRLAMLVEFGDTYRSAGDSDAALRAYDEALAISGRIAERMPDEGAKRERALVLQRSGILKHSIGQSTQALAELEEALAIGRQLVAAHPDDVDLWQHMSRCLNNIGDIKKRAGESAEALAAFTEAAEIGRRAVAAKPDSIEWKQELAASLLHTADMKAVMSEIDGALAAYKEALVFWRQVAEKDPGNLAWQQDVSVGLTSLADVELGAHMDQEALAAYEESLAIRRRLVASDSGNREWQRDLGEALERVALVHLRSGDLDAARAPLSEALELRRRLVSIDPGNLEWQRDVSATLIRLGDVYFQSGDAAAATAAFEEGLAILRRLTERESTNTRWQRNLAGALLKTGEMNIATGAIGEAQRLFDEAITIRKGLIEMDPANTYWRIELVKNLEDIAGWTTGKYRSSAIEQALAILQTLRTEGVLTDSDAELERHIRAMSN